MIKRISNSILILISNIAAKGISFTASILLVRNLVDSEFAEWTYYRSFLLFVIPLASIGMDQTLLKFSYHSSTNKEDLKNSTFTLGIIGSVAIFLTVIILVNIIRPNTFHNDLLFIGALLPLVTMQFNNFQLMLLRINENFKKYSLLILLTSFFSSIMLIVGSLLSIEIMAYLFAATFVFISLSQLNNWKFNPLNIIALGREKINYGVNIGIGGVLNKSLYAVDLIYLGTYYTDPKILAGYKVATLLPFNLLLISNSILIADFSEFVHGGRNETLIYLQRYGKRLLSILIPFAVIVVGLNENILVLFFGNQYSGNGSTLIMYYFFIAFVILIRSPVGAILNAKGYAKFNTVMAVIQSIMLFCIFLLPEKLDETQLIGYFFAVTFLLTIIQSIKLWKI